MGVKSRSSRRDFIKHVGAVAGAFSVLPGCVRRGARMAGRGSGERRDTRPNVVLILTDDQGYGDLGCHGNPHLRTPNLDRLHGESVRFTQCCVSPVCTPTRASLMTGRYHMRTGAIDTYRGRAMMYPDEVTIAEMLRAGGYRTGIFGKWHLGDNYPLRAMDQGFDEAVVHRGGGLLQPSSPPGDSYFAPIVWRNGRQEQIAGYCTDVFTDAAIDFIERNRKGPFFAYLSTNAPHAPLHVDDRYVAPYRAMGLDEPMAKVYGMVANLDENIGRVFAKLDELGLAENTIVIFMTDNGPASSRYNAGMRGKKGEVYEGGIRVPCFVRWPGRLEAGKDIARLAAHIDVAPTLLDLCGVHVPPEVRFDGMSLAPLMRGHVSGWADRTLFFQWHRGDVPEPYRNAAARTQRFKLVNGRELYDLEADPAEQHDVAAEHPDIVARLRAEYDAWFQDVGATRGYSPPRIELGTPHENPSVLTRQDWRGIEGLADKDLDKGVGYWEVLVARAGQYEFTVDFAAQDAAATAWIACGDIRLSRPVVAGATSCRVKGARLSAGAARLQAWVEYGGVSMGARFLTVERVR